MNGWFSILQIVSLLSWDFCKNKHRRPNDEHEHKRVLKVVPRWALRFRVFPITCRLKALIGQTERKEWIVSWIIGPNDNHKIHNSYYSWPLSCTFRSNWEAPSLYLNHYTDTQQDPLTVHLTREDASNIILVQYNRLYGSRCAEPYLCFDADKRLTFVYCFAHRFGCAVSLMDLEQLYMQLAAGSVSICASQDTVLPAHTLCYTYRSAEKLKLRIFLS